MHASKESRNPAGLPADGPPVRNRLGYSFAAESKLIACSSRLPNSGRCLIGTWVNTTTIMSLAKSRRKFDREIGTLEAKPGLRGIGIFAGIKDALDTAKVRVVCVKFCKKESG